MKNILCLQLKIRNMLQTSPSPITCIIACTNIVTCIITYIIVNFQLIPNSFLINFQLTPNALLINFQLILN